MSFNFIFLRTIDLKNKEIEEITEIFYISFNKKISIEQLRRKYCTNKFGYSFHCLYRDKSKKLIGVYTFIPRIFFINSKLKYALQTVDTCFPYKGIAFAIKDSVLNLVEFSQLYVHPLSFIYGFPNKSFEKLSGYIFEWQRLDKLITYIDCLPLLSFLFSKRRKFGKQKSDIYIQIENSELKSRYNSFLWDNFKINKSEFMYFWFTVYLIPIQIFTFKDLHIKKIINIFFDNPFKFVRFLIPSITSTTKDKFLLPWHIRLKKNYFNLHIKILNDQIKIEDLSETSTLIWNDVP